jgi:hypothetical protein
MRRLCIIAVMTAAIVLPAFAQSANADARHSRQWQDRLQSQDVISGNRYLGRDPDPNIRFELMRQQNWRKGG